MSVGGTVYQLSQEMACHIDRPRCGRIRLSKGRAPRDAAPETLDEAVHLRMDERDQDFFAAAKYL